MDLAFAAFQAVGLFFAAVAIWAIQSAIVLGFCRRAIYPTLYRNTLTTWLIAQPSIIFHELAHFFFAVVSGSQIKVKESFISPTAGRIAAVHEESFFGWVSRVVAAIAPSVGPPAFVAVLTFVAAQQFEFDSTVLLYPDDFAALSQNADIAWRLFAANAQIFLNMITNLASPIAYLLIYFAIIGTIAAGPSIGDWRTMVELLLSPVPALSLFAIFGIFLIGFGTLGYGLFVPFVTLIAFLFFVTVAGVALALALTIFFTACYKFGMAALLLLAAYAISYVTILIAWPEVGTPIAFAAAFVPPLTALSIIHLHSKLQRYR